MNSTISIQSDLPERANRDSLLRLLLSVLSSFASLRVFQPCFNSIGASCTANAIYGLLLTSPGVKRTITQSLLPSIAFAANLGNKPAPTSDDLPEPDAPTTATKRFVTTFSTSSSVSLPRPKKIVASSWVKARNPGNGEPGQGVEHGEIVGALIGGFILQTTALISSATSFQA